MPDCELVLLVRDGKRTSAAERARKEILKNDAFDRLRAEHGADFDTVIAGRITTVAGDVDTDGLGLNDADRAVWASCDTIIHSAAAVSFDSPLDSAVEINLLGPSRIADLCNELGITPHLVAVSTCYVAGNRRGNAPGDPRQRRSVRHRHRLAQRSRRQPAPRAPTATPPAVNPPASSSSAPTPAPSSAPPARPRSPPRPNNSASAG